MINHHRARYIPWRACANTLRPEAKPSTGLLEELRSSPGLLLALLGQQRDAPATPRAYLRSSSLRASSSCSGCSTISGPTGQQEPEQARRIDPSILVTLLNPLEADGLLSRQRDTADRRRHLVTPHLVKGATPPDRGLRRAQRDAEDELFAGLDDRQREQLRILLMALKDTLSHECQPATTSGQCTSAAPSTDCQ